MSLRGRLKQAGRAIRDAVASGQDNDEATDILATLKHEHDEVKGLLSELQDANTAAQRRRLVKEIKAALLPHTKAEEKVVYDAVIRLRDKDAQTDGHEGYLEHEWASRTLQRLESITNVTSPEHRAAAKVLKELVEHHIQEEENQVWADVKKHFSDTRRAQMNTAFLNAKARVRVT